MIACVSGILCRTRTLQFYLQKIALTFPHLFGGNMEQLKAQLLSPWVATVRLEVGGLP